MYVFRKNSETKYNEKIEGVGGENMRRNIHFVKSIGEELRKIRLERKKKVNEIANDIGVSKTYISEIERDRKIPSVEIVKKISKAYNVEQSYLYKGFKLIPKEMMDEIIKNEYLYDLIFALSFEKKMSEEHKSKFYQELWQLYIERRENDNEL